MWVVQEKKIVERNFGAPASEQWLGIMDGILQWFELEEGECQKCLRFLIDNLPIKIKVIMIAN